MKVECIYNMEDTVPNNAKRNLAQYPPYCKSTQLSYVNYLYIRKIPNAFRPLPGLIMGWSRWNKQSLSIMTKFQMCFFSFSLFRFESPFFSPNIQVFLSVNFFQSIPLVFFFSDKIRFCKSTLYSDFLPSFFFMFMFSWPSLYPWVCP